jgi:hypothetical protein
MGVEYRSVGAFKALQFDRFGDAPSGAYPHTPRIS